MTPNPQRFRDSDPLRMGVGIITAVVLLVVAGVIAAFGFRHDFAIGPAGIWAFRLALGAGLVIVGIGQTIVRRKDHRGPDGFGLQHHSPP